MRYRREQGGIITGMLAFLGILVACGIFLFAVLATRVRVTESHGRGVTHVETPFGSLTVRERAGLDPAALGLPVYPGARRMEDTRRLASFELDLGDDHKDLTVAVAEYVTDDPISEVEAYYKSRFDGVRVKHDRTTRVVLESRSGTLKRVVVLRSATAAAGARASPLLP